MFEEFPTIGLIGESSLQRMFLGPANALGIKIVNLKENADVTQLAECTVISVLGTHVTDSQMRTLETSGHLIRPTSSAMEFVKRWNVQHQVNAPTRATISILVALSPHGQASTWAPTGIHYEDSISLAITPMPTLSPSEIGALQRIALDLAKETGAIGVVEVEIVFTNGKPAPRRIFLGPTFNGVWSIEGARTSQFEQHLRAILDLPLGDPSQTASFAVTGAFLGGGNMYRPYLHLMARSPALKIHQYLPGSGQVRGHVCAMGSDLLDLRECVTHAVEYMNGAIDE